jgi:hypothetical protein
MTSEQLGKLPRYDFQGMKHNAGLFVSYTDIKSIIAETCNWIKDKDNEYNTWNTDCGNMFTIEGGTPKENGMTFCCYCGRKIT